MESAENRVTSPLRRRVGYGLVALSLGWAAFVLATIGSADDRYFRTCTGSCEAEMPENYPIQHALLAVVFIAVPCAIVAAVWFFSRWLSAPPAKPERQR